jgi:CO/xanthine dehydrogenase Mo-binding subunit
MYTGQSLALDAIEDFLEEYEVLKPGVDLEQALVDNTNLVFELYETNLFVYFSEKWNMRICISYC